MEPKMRYSHPLGNNIMNVVQNLMEKIRPLVGLKGWDYSVVWKLTEDQRYIELVDCCCAGAEERTQNGGEGLQFPVSAILPCRDVLVQHPRTKSCELLAQIPSSIPLDNNGIHGQTLISSIPRWLNFSNNSESSILEEEVGTRVLIPVPGGLIELFVANQVSEDQQTIDFVTCQCNIFMDQDSSFSAANMNMMNEQKEQINQLQQQAPVSPSPPSENLNLPYDISLDRIRLCSSPMNFLQHLNYNEENRTKSDGIYEGMENGVLLQDMDSVSVMTNYTNMNLQYVDLENKDNQHQPGNNNDKDSVKQENGGSPDSLSDCNDQMDDEDDAKYRRRTGKGQSKNLIAERKRRKKLNDRLYTLRSLVPNISKLDRASILGDAIEFVKELQRQAKELQDELEEQHSDDEGGRNGNRNIRQQEIILSQSGLNPGSASDLHGMNNGFHVGAPGSKLNQESEINHDKGHQMEPQVEVAQLDGTEFFVRVFSEHKPGGFVKLMDAFDSLGLEVTNANVTSNRGLVSNVFNVVKKDSEMVQADYVRDSLLELTRNMPRGWPEMAKPPENCSPGVDQHNHHQHGLMHNGHIINGTHHHFHD